MQKGRGGGRLLGVRGLYSQANPLVGLCLALSSPCALHWWQQSTHPYKTAVYGIVAGLFIDGFLKLGTKSVTLVGNEGGAVGF
jgi:hypothetical protein